MAVSQTPRLGITRWSAGTDPFGRAQLDTDHSKLEDLAAIDLQGTRTARPAAAIRGRYYFATDIGVVYRDDGATWHTVGFALGGSAPTASNPGDAGAEGTSNIAARVDHKHAREAHGANEHTDYARKDGTTFTGVTTYSTTATLALRRYAEYLNALTSAATTTLDCTNGMAHNVTLTQNTTLAIVGLTSVAGVVSSLTIILKQDATGGRIVTWPAGTKWPDGLAPTLSTAANAVNVVTLMTPDAGTTWYGYLAGRNMS